MRFDKTQITDIEIDGIDMGDYPDFADSAIVSAYYKGEPMTEEEIEQLNNDKDFVYEKVFEKLF